MAENCSTHRIIMKQTFSLAEMEFFVAHAGEFRICKDCTKIFERRIVEKQEAALCICTGVFPHRGCPIHGSLK